MQRHEISEREWKAIRARWPQRRGPRVEASDRAFINAVVWIAKTGAPWRDVPECYGPWKTIYNRFRSWAARDGWMQVFQESVALNAGCIGGILDASIVRAHQDAADLTPKRSGVREAASQARSTSR